MTRARNLAGLGTVTSSPTPIHIGPIGVLTATRIDGEFNVVDIASRDITAQGIGVTNLQVSGITTGLNVSGIITAQNGINFNGTSTGLNVSGIGTIATLNVSGNATISGNANIGGVLTYEDVTNVDSVGVVTARGLDIFGNTTGLKVASGISTFQAVTGTTGTFSGAVSGTTGTFSGAVSGTTGTFSAAVSGTTGTFSGAVSGTTGTFSGAVSGTTGTFSGAVSGTTGTFSAAVSGTTGTFSGAVAGTTGTFSGAVSGTTGTFTGDLTIPDKIVHTGDTDTAIRLGTDTVTVETAGNERVRISSGGNFGINQTNPQYLLHVTGTTSAARIACNDSASGISALAVTNETNADLESVIFTNRSSLGSSVNIPISFHTNGKTNEKIRMHTTGELSVPSGVTLGLTAADKTASNTLDDYEEGSWTPSIRNEGTTANWNSQTGTYVKIGQQVTVWFNADGGSDPRSGGSSSSLIMTGLPFSQSIFSNPILGHVGANKSSGTGLYSTSGLILSPFGQGGDQVRFGCGGQAINFSISYVAGCLTYTAAS